MPVRLQTLSLPLRKSNTSKMGPIANVRTKLSATAIVAVRGRSFIQETYPSELRSGANPVLAKARAATRPPALRGRRGRGQRKNLVQFQIEHEDIDPRLAQETKCPALSMIVDEISDLISRSRPAHEQFGRSATRRRPG